MEKRYCQLTRFQKNQFIYFHVAKEFCHCKEIMEGRKICLVLSKISLLHLPPNPAQIKYYVEEINYAFVAVLKVFWKQNVFFFVYLFLTILFFLKNFEEVCFQIFWFLDKFVLKSKQHLPQSLNKLVTRIRVLIQLFGRVLNFDHPI